MASLSSATIMMALAIWGLLRWYWENFAPAAAKPALNYAPASRPYAAGS